VRPHCLPDGLDDLGLERFHAELLAGQRKVGAGDALFRSGDGFESLYAVRTGFFKTVSTTRQGLDQVTGFQMAGDLLGLDGIGAGVHAVAAVALEDARVCVIQFAALQRLARELPDLQERFHRLLARELARNYLAMVQLGSMYAEERLAAFVLDLAARLEARGFSHTAFVLRMTRAEIGSYLGLKLETVSRTFSKFQVAGLLHVAHREIRITDPAGLRQVVDGAPA
jgi:CRP/FNR family transcriptional regulator